MADIRLGNNNTTFKVGSTDVDAIYLGTTLVYSGGTPPTFQGKWLATYSDSSTTSAECDSTSAITQNEIGKTNLVSVEIGDCVKTIGNFAFRLYTGLTSIDIPDSVTSIEQYAFDSCGSLTSVAIPNSVTSIGNRAFYYCNSLTSCTIGSGVTSIGTTAFYRCTSLTSITIPDSVTTIGVGVFNGCSGFTSIEIPSGVTSIGNNAFKDCYKLESITVNATTPPTLGGSGAFANTNDCPIYVPSESVETYKTASGWSDYASRIQAIP